MTDAQRAALLELLGPWKCCGAPNLCGAACMDDELSHVLAAAYRVVAEQSTQPPI